MAAAIPLPETPVGDWAQDELDMAGLYSILENEVVPLYYDREMNGIPGGWCRIVKNAIRTGAPRFSARRMVKEYVNRAYTPLLHDEMKSQQEKLA